MLSQIKQAARDVFEHLGKDHSESVYQNAMETELRNRKIGYESQKMIPIYYKGSQVGFHRLDLVVDGNIIIELKVTNPRKKDEDQLLCYIHTMNQDKIVQYEGLLIHFSNTLVFWTPKTSHEEISYAATNTSEDTSEDILDIDVMDHKASVLLPLFPTFNWTTPQPE